MNLRPFLIVAAVIIGGMLVLSGWAWMELPPGAEIPVHWGIDGRPDRFAPKEIGLLGLPAIALLTTALFVAIPRFEPRRGHLERSATAYRATAIAVVALLALVHAGAVLAAIGRPVDVAALAVVGIGVMLVVIGNYLGKVRSTFMFGIRTPWTLTSERSWALTHRLGGRLLVGLGFAVVLAVLVGVRGATLFVVLLGGLTASVAILLRYAYVVWSNDPERSATIGDGR
jgi:uncharacterized membrane protein